MGGLFVAIAVGLATGVLAGAFGIGGGIVTTPAVRLLLGMPRLVAVGTPLAVIVPTAAAGALGYAHRGQADVGSGVRIGLAGAVSSVGGAYLTRLSGGRVVLLITAALIVGMAADMAIGAVRGTAGTAAVDRTVGPAAGPASRNGVGATMRADEDRRKEEPLRLGRLLALGSITGLVSGFLGLGGGFVLVPVLVRHFGLPAKRAFGTSLVSIVLIAVPGAISHWALGHVRLGLAAALTAGALPGALLGAAITAAAAERTVRLGFAALLATTGIALAVFEAGVV